MAADVPALRATGRHGVRQAAPRRGAQLRLDAQAVDEATVFDSIVKTCWRSARAGVVFRQPQMVEILHADDQRCRRLSPGDGGDDLLQLGQTGARAAAGWRHGET